MTYNQRKPWSGYRGAHVSERGRGGAGSGGSFHKVPVDAKTRGSSVSSTGSNYGRSENRDFVAPVFIDPKMDRSEQLNQLKKERKAAKYNVLLPFRRAKLFCPRAYQQALYTPTLILVQELWALAEASCSSPLSKEDELELNMGSSSKEENAPPRLVQKRATKYILDD